MFKYRSSRTTSRIPLCLRMACFLSLLSGALSGNDTSQNLSSISPSGCQLVNTSHGTKATCKGLGLPSVPQDLPGNTTVLDLSVNQIKTLYNESFTHLPNIIILALQKNVISMIEGGAFKHLSNLTVLSLGKNQLDPLPTGLFGSNHLLLKLILCGNRLSSIPSDTLPLFNSIIVLDLSGNNISFIHPDDFTPFHDSSIQKLYLTSNNLNKLPSNVFSHFNRINKLILSHNAFHQFHISSVSGNVEINHLYLQSCKIQDVIPLNRSQIYLKGPPKILFFHLEWNKLCSFPDFAFWGLNQTNTLILQRNHITVLSNRSFCGLDTLVELDLSYNLLASLPSGVFSCIKMLQQLKLVGNKIGSWTIGILSGIPSLYHLDLAHNDINNVQSSWNITIPSLEYLDLSFNKFTKIKKYLFWGFTNLKILNMSHNEIRDAYSPNSFTKLTNLKELYLTNQHCQNINKAFRYIDGLSILDLSFAPLKVLSKRQFTNTTSLAKLGLRENDLRSTDLFDIETSKSLFLGLKSLIKLDIRGNQLDMLAPGTFIPLRRLQILFLAQSSIKVLSPGVLDSLTSLRILDLRDNEISAIPADLLQSQPRLSVFHISNNRLDSIPKTLFNDTLSLKRLYMQGNRITTIEPGTVFPTNRTLIIDASGNPFSCTCDLGWFVDWLHTGNVELNHPDDTLCSLSSIKDMVHSPILAFHPDKYCGINISIVTGVPLSVILIAVLSVVAYRKRWWLNYKAFHLKLAVFGYEEINHDFDAQDYEYQLNLMYEEDDQGWVDQVMKPVLQERFPQLQKVVYGDNNLNIGMFYLEAYHYAVENSFKTVLLLSNNSVGESWFITKLRIALEHLNDTRLDKVILIFLEDIQDEDLPYLARLFLSKNKPYMLWTEDEDGQELFWAQLEKSMRANRAINNVIPL